MGELVLIVWPGAGALAQALEGFVVFLAGVDIKSPLSVRGSSLLSELIFCGRGKKGNGSLWPAHTCVPLMAQTTCQHGPQECAGWEANLSQKRAPCLVGLGQDELLKLVKAQLHIAGGNGIVPAGWLHSGVGGW